MKPIEPIKIEKDMKVSELVESMGGVVFGAGNIHKASEIMTKMFSDSDCKVFQGVETKGIMSIKPSLTPTAKLSLKLESVTPLKLQEE